ncbi:MAG: hypothetical protein IKY53_06860 [Lachnospiraceae bacterium]|nr:hypothetical protein [Lachnospiraceae bacterium]
MIWLIASICIGVIPAICISFAVTGLILNNKHKIGTKYIVEFNGHTMRVLEEYECSERALEDTVRLLKQGQRR